MDECIATHTQMTEIKIVKAICHINSCWHTLTAKNVNRSSSEMKLTSQHWNESLCSRVFIFFFSFFSLKCFVSFLFSSFTDSPKNACISTERCNSVHIASQIASFAWQSVRISINPHFIFCGIHLSSVSTAFFRCLTILHFQTKLWWNEKKKYAPPPLIDFN